MDARELGTGDHPGESRDGRRQDSRRLRRADASPASPLGRDGSETIGRRIAFARSAFQERPGVVLGREAERIASIVIPKVNRFGGDKRAVASAVEAIESTGGTEGYLERLSQISEGFTRNDQPSERKWWRDRSARQLTTGLFALPQQHRLAFEMALHEEAERRAIQGELADLERAWREAEEIAGIADSLLLPETVDQSFERMRRESASGDQPKGTT